MSYYLGKENFEILSVTFERETIDKLEERALHALLAYVTKCMKQKEIIHTPWFYFIFSAVFNCNLVHTHEIHFKKLWLM